MDADQADAADAVAALKSQGVRKTVMLTGDSGKVAANVAEELGIDRVYSELLPGDKVDEVEKLPLEMGDKLADALTHGLPATEKGGKPRMFDVRVIAACDSNLKRLADKGLFSRNLYELVLDTTMRVPPLRERVKDIEVIASHILVEMSAQHNLPQKRLSPEAVSLLLSCSWPGNIKQLQGVIEQAFFHTPGSIIEAENIKLPGDKTLERSWKYDKEAFIAAWKSAGGNISKLATMLDVSRVTLYRYLKKYGLGPKAK